MRAASGPTVADAVSLSGCINTGSDAGEFVC